jgi:hypothetical protein
MHDGSTLQKQTTVVRVPVSAFNFFFLNMFYTHKHSIKLCSNTSVIELYVSKVYLCSIGGVRNAYDPDISLIFL